MTVWIINKIATHFLTHINTQRERERATLGKNVDCYCYLSLFEQWQERKMQLEIGKMRLFLCEFVCETALNYSFHHRVTRSLTSAVVLFILVTHFSLFARVPFFGSRRGSSSSSIFALFYCMHIYKIVWCTLEHGVGGTPTATERYVPFK